MTNKKAEATRKEKREMAREHARIQREIQARKEKQIRFLWQSGLVVAAIAIIAGIWAIVAFGGGVEKINGETSPQNLATNGAIFTNPTTITQSGKYALTEAPKQTTDVLEGDKVHVELYLDFQCVHCADFEESYSEYLKTKLQQEQITLEIKPVTTLGTQLSFYTPSLFACVVEHAPQVAYDTKDQIFALQNNSGAVSKNRIGDAIIKNLTVDDETRTLIHNCYRSEQYINWTTVATDYAMAETSATGAPKVAGTPAVFVNGKNWRESGVNNFIQFVEEEIVNFNNPPQEDTSTE